jgi:hypothetical protein
VPSPQPSQVEPQVRLRRWALGVLAFGALLLLAPIATSWAQFTSTSKNTASVTAATDWTPPTVAMTYPGDAIAGTVTLSATATDAETGIASVTFAWAPTGTTTWTTICADTTSPYGCAFATGSLAEQDIDFLVTATDKAGYAATDLVEGITIDNTAPSVSLNSIASPLSGVVTIGATASDAGSGVGSVTIQRAPAGTTTWTTLCSDVDSPYSCRFDTTPVTDGLYDFRAIAVDAAGNSATSSLVRNRLVSNLVSSVSVDDPGAFIRGTVTITANANASLGVASVKIQRQATGSSTWVDLCTDTTSPYSCSWNTTTVADGGYSFRAILTDSLGTTTTSAVAGPSQVDNTLVRGYDVQATSGGSPGKLGAGDTISFTYSKVMSLTSILAGWDGTSKAVVVRARDGKVLGLTDKDDTLDVFTTSAYSTAVNLGSVNLKGNFIKGGKTVPVNATMTQSTVTVNGVSATKVTLTFGTVVSGAGNLRTATTTPVNMLWTPSVLATDAAGSACSTATVTELGTSDRDF